jgi:hypothetical protein
MAIKCFRASHIGALETEGKMLALYRLRTSIHVLFIELA